MGAFILHGTEYDIMIAALCQFIELLQADTYPEPESSIHNSVISQILPIVRAKLPLAARVLDVGCGQGCAMKAFEAAGFDVTGTTLNHEDFAFLQAKFPGQVHFGEQNDLPEGWNNSFDLVWARHVIEHSIMPYFTLYRFREVLKEGGLLYLEVPAPDTSCHHEANVNHYSVLGRQMWVELIHRAKFEIVEGRQFNLNTEAGPDIYWSFICKKLNA